MRAVNLLPKDDRRTGRRSPNPVVLGAVGGALVVVLGLGVSSMSASSAVAEAQSELENRKLELQLIPAPPAPPSAVQTQLADERARRSTAFAGALAERLPWDRLLRRFALVLPDDVWLASLSARAPAGPPTPGSVPTDFTITGFTYSHDGVARLLSRLAVIPDLESVQLQNSTLATVGGRRVVQFAIAAAVRREGIAS